MIGVSTALLSTLAQGASQEHARRALGMTEPDKYPSKDAYHPLADAAIDRAKAIAPDSSPLIVGNTEFVPSADTDIDPLLFASHIPGKTADGREVSRININPNADRSYYAHELGHAVSRKNKVGKFVSDTRAKIARNPKLGDAVMTGLTIGVPGIAAALQEGDDDAIGSIALAAALASPTLIDEALASKNALAIMKDAGMKATLGQRGRLAGAYMTYLAPVLLAGGLGTAIGNVADDYTAVYDL